ncbi:MAG: Ig-like domain-containing protein [Halorientalis sp.]
MSFRDDERGQAIQVGAVLLFAALIIAFSTYQAFVVPSQNREVEFKHSQQVQAELLEVRNAIVSIPGGDSGRAIGVTLGTRYPSRLVALNPGPATGTLRTVGTTDPRYNLTIRNATAGGAVGDFWNGSAHTYNTGGLVYAPNYNLYDAPRTVYENTVLYNDGGDRTVPLTGQQLIEGNRITLVTLNGSLGITRAGTTTVDLRALSTSTQTVTVSNDAHNLTISVPTQLSASQWRDLTRNEDHVRGLTVEDGALGDGWGLLHLDLESGTTYNLRMAKVGVGTGATDTEPGYLLPVEGNGSTVPEGGTQRVVVEVRDRYNNPIAGVEVNASVSLPDASVTPVQQVTDENGQVILRYNATDVDISGVAQRTERLNVSFDTPPGALSDATFDRQAPENATVELTIRNTDGSGPTSGGLTYNGDAVAADGPGSGGTPAGVNFSISNNFNGPVTVTDITIIPEDGGINYLSDDATPNGEIATSEVYVSGDLNDGFVDVGGDGVNLPAIVDLDQDGFLNDGNPRISAGSDATFYLYEFEDFEDDERNMTGERVEITVDFRLDNGLSGEKTFTIDPTFDGGGGGGGGGNSSPSVTIDSTTVTSIGGNTNGKNDIQVEFTGSDPDGNLDSYTVTVYDSSSQTTQIGSTSSTTYTGGTETVTISDNDANSGSTPYYVVVTVTDSQGASDTDEQST